MDTAREPDEAKLLEQLRRLDTASLSDALDSLGWNGGLEGIVPRVPDVALCGRAFTVEYRPPDESERKEARAADFIDLAGPDDVLVLANHGRTDCTVWGGILTAVAERRGIAGTVIDGACRDVDEILRREYPLFSKAVFMKTGKGRTRKHAHQVPVSVCGVEIHPGDYLRGDGNGVLVIPARLVAETVARACAVRDTEASILAAVKNGALLAEARARFAYHRPWEPPAATAR